MENTTYSNNVHTLEQNGRTIILVGTAHVSQSSIDEVHQVIEQEQPDTVCVELCESRYEAIRSDHRWKNMDVFKVIREQKTFLLLANLILSSFQKKLGKKLGVQPGAEMLEACKSAESVDAEIVLADRDVQTTLRKAWRSLSFIEKQKILAQLVMSVFLSEEISEAEIEKMKEQDVLSEALDTFAKQSPTLKRVLIDERDQYLAEKIRQAPGDKVVAVVGAGHIPGIKKELEQEHSIEELESLPPAGNLGTWLKWLIPTFIIGAIVYGFVAIDKDVSLEMVKRWVLFNGVLAMVGSMIARAHPITIVTSFIAAPITSLNPAIAAGWVAGLVEASLRKPQVRDFEHLSEDILTLGGFWKNKITRILLVVVLTNLGSALGTFISIPAITSLL